MKVDESNSADFYADSSGDFFESLENDVNSMVKEESQVNPITETTQVVQKADNKAKTGSQRIDWKKRYQDSSREAQRMHSEMQNLKPYAAIIEAMKKDGGLVDHVRGYLEDGGSNQSIQNKLGLGEDFEFDANELGDPNSDSSKVLNAHVDKLVQNRMTQINQVQTKKAQQAQLKQERLAEEKKFRANHPEMTDDQYEDLLLRASKRKLSLEDIHYIINRDSANNKVAQNVKKDMVEQMKNARNIPASASGLNSAPTTSNASNDIFDAVKGVDEELDNLFG
tara:strand:+ start:7761 stop:8603 length:843 start_codon:yes stop_codon:yes gene_type:complete